MKNFEFKNNNLKKEQESIINNTQEGLGKIKEEFKIGFLCENNSNFGKGINKILNNYL